MNIRRAGSPRGRIAAGSPRGRAALSVNGIGSAVTAFVI